MNCIFEKVFVETPVDTDGDGKYDLIAVYIKRPKSSLTGEPVPAVYVANPYMLSCNEDWYVPHNVNTEVKSFQQQSISEESIRFDFDQTKKYEITYSRETAGFAGDAIVEKDVELECISDLYAHLNQRGYASVFCGGLGTKGSEGLTLTGSREEILAFKSVIDWLNGRCRGFTNKVDNIEVKADWCTGSVAMSAKSYLGTMCIGVAATGVEGLKTIIPEAAIANWYDYYRYNGLNLPAIEWQGDDLDILAKYCFSRAKDPEDYEQVKDTYAKALAQLVEGEDRESGNYNLFWDERNYLNQIEKIKASVFIIHGNNDWNVKTNQCFPFFQALEKQGIPRKMLIHQGEHVYVYHLKKSNTLEIIDRWLDYYLKGIENGIDKEPKVLIESNLNQEEWYTSDTWPPKEIETKNFTVAGEGIVTIVDDLSTTVYEYDKDNLKDWLDELVLNEESAHRLKYVWDIADVRLAGTCKVAFDAAIDQPTGILSAMVVDVGDDQRITAEEIPVEDGKFVFGREAEPSKYKAISRGWLNPQNRSSIWSKEELKTGEFYHYEFNMVPTDYTIKPGHKLALILYGIDAEATQRPKTVTTIKIDEKTIRLTVPLI